MSFGNSSCQTRPATQAGRFYTADAKELKAEVQSYLQENADQPVDSDVAAIIVPHAGYVFSGKVAASAYARLDPKKAYDRVFLLGPSHYEWLDGASVNTDFDNYSTPLGEVPVDLATAKKLIEADSVFKCNPKAHDREHCLEVQLPFLQVRFGKVPPIVPIIISTNRLADLQRMAKVLKPYFNAKNLFIVSSDFSHYPEYHDACRVDSLTKEAILSGKTERLIEQLQSNAEAGVPNLQTSACGAFAIITLMEMLDDHYSLEAVRYQNSGDTYASERRRVVGYQSIVVHRKEGGFMLTDEEKHQLHAIAKESIASALERRPYKEQGITEKLKTPCGAFVTLTEDGRLRGCIGHIGEDVPLYQVVRQMAQSAAFGDPRFPRLEKEEFPKVKIEISVLTPMKRISGPDEFVLGRDGLLIRKGYNSGTFLPQVADEVDWTKEEFFGHCSRDKAGLGWDGWKDAELYTYQAIVF
jgi:AmmeMemoRadiSam system protein B/AmmeMemoRadiSam system protein A